MSWYCALHLPLFSSLASPQHLQRGLSATPGAAPVRMKSTESSHHSASCRRWWWCSIAHVQLFATPWTAACQVSLSLTISQNLLKLMSIVDDAIQPSHSLSPPSPPALNLSLWVMRTRGQRWWKKIKHCSLLQGVSEPVVTEGFLDHSARQFLRKARDGVLMECFKHSEAWGTPVG